MENAWLWGAFGLGIAFLVPLLLVWVGLRSQLIDAYLAHDNFVRLPHVPEVHRGAPPSHDTLAWLMIEWEIYRTPIAENMESSLQSLMRVQRWWVRLIYLPCAVLLALSLGRWLIKAVIEMATGQ
ncbi:hypothetical protein AEYBE204_17280 [Asticcacaulis sp. YBE204]|nr:hypothetical protein AEYBE204_17280 [Asticcacaulis sp. YBE204]